ncbi:type II RES/Xre toxin-antitoxin system antitoxin [Aequorivita capsosiphonis]|uniref:type II RES/Xre toxin-antitoxin system antitoxin n=1 Tax=Aequorivita capsosiphonis TaxID=487317 RepID=UPI0003FD2D72|nr:antitoxin Xre/MbcA/ParS toxin-binding domain-containing protein [Aequorivita capsosiphonis]
MSDKKSKMPSRTKAMDPEKSVQRARARRAESPYWSIVVAEDKYTWNTKMGRVGIIRQGLPYESIEVISTRTNLPVKHVLNLLGVAQTTYNKKKKDKDLLTGRDSEVILVLVELLDFGLEVFNNEKEKFQRWLKKPNISLGGVSPESLFDSLTGIQEVRNILNRLEYGNMA